MMSSASTMDLMSKIFVTVIPLVCIVLVGFLYARKNNVDMSTANKLNMDLFIPALLFSVLSSKSFDVMQYKDLALAAMAVIIGSGIIIFPLCKRLNWNTKTFIPPMMFNNSGNLGLPLAVLAFGEAALPAAVMLFLVENTLHFTLGIYLLDRKASMISMLRIPSIVAAILGITWSFTHWTVPPVIALFIEMLGEIAIPLMLFALGVRMTNIDFSLWRIGILGALLCPLTGLTIAIPIVYTGYLSATEASYLVLFAALPPAVLNFMVAEQYNQEPQKVASIVLLGNLGALLVIPATLAFIL